MDFDKRTGRGCAWSIMSKTIARKLVDDGIVGKEIARKNITYRCDSIRIAAAGPDLENVHVMWWESIGATEQPLWTPTFIDPAIWRQAASQFRPGELLTASVERYLLPEMGGYLRSLTDSGLYQVKE